MTNKREQSQNAGAELFARYSDESMPKRKLATEQVFNSIDGGLAILAHVDDPEEAFQINELVDAYSETMETSLQTQEEQRSRIDKQNEITRAVNRIVQAAFDRKMSGQ